MPHERASAENASVLRSSMEDDMVILGALIDAAIVLAQEADGIRQPNPCADALRASNSLPVILEILEAKADELGSRIFHETRSGLGA